MSGENSGRGRGGFGQRRGQGGSRGRGRFDHKKHFGTKVNRSKEEGDEIKRLKARYNEVNNHHGTCVRPLRLRLRHMGFSTCVPLTLTFKF